MVYCSQCNLNMSQNVPWNTCCLNCSKSLNPDSTLCIQEGFSLVIRFKVIWQYVACRNLTKNSGPDPNHFRATIKTGPVTQEVLSF